MEENFRKEVPSASLDLAVEEGYRNELTRTNSDASSITVNNSAVLPPLKKNTRQWQSTKWTDEKHNSYLAALEESFLKQLHQSLGLLSRCSEQNTFNPSPSQQLPVNGYWQKMNCARNQPADGSHVVIERPWMGHFTGSDKHRTASSSELQERNSFREMSFRGRQIIFSNDLTSSGQQGEFHKCHQDADSTIAEVSDQNFADEDQEEKLSSLSRLKRRKMAASDASTKDQIVPYGSLFTAETTSASITTS